LLICLIGAASAAREQIAAVLPAIATVEEPNGDIEITADLPADGKITRSFRLSRPAGAPTVDLKFLPNDLTAPDGSKIDRGSVLVIAPAKLDPGLQDYRLELSGITRPGQYTGSLLLRTADAKAPQAVAIKLKIRPARPLSLAADTAKLNLQIATSCDRLTAFVLGRRGCPNSYRFAITGKPASNVAPELDLLLVDASQSAVEVGKGVNVSWATGRLGLSIDDGALQPGHYSGHLHAAYDAGATVIDAPIEIDVRWPAWIAILCIMGGVLLGWGWAWYIQTGNKLASAIDRLGRDQQRLAAFDDDLQIAFDPTLSSTWRQINDRQEKEANAALDKMEVCLNAAAAIDILGMDHDFSQAPLAALRTQLLDQIRLNDDTGATTTLAAIRQAAAPLITGFADGPTNPQVKRAHLRHHARLMRASLEVWALTKGGRWAFWSVLLCLLTWAGLYSLYVNSGAKFGAAPAADILTLIAWGVTADVSSRTIANFRGASPTG